MQACQRQNAELSGKQPTLDLVPAALAYLARYASGTAHLRLVLMRKAERRAARAGTPVPAATVVAAIETAVARARHLGLLDDGAYAANLARQYRARGEAIPKIRARLRAKGLEPADVAAALHQLGEEDEVAAATRFAKRKRLGRHRQRLGKPDQVLRDIAALCRAGFSVAVARAMIGDQDN